MYAVAPTNSKAAQDAVAAAAPYAMAHNGWRTSNFVNSFQTERTITILNAIVGNWGVAMFPAGGEETASLGVLPQPAFPRVDWPLP